MKIVQTAWSCNQKDLMEVKAGWLSAEYHLMSWALSCLQLKQYYNDVTLYADMTSAKMLIDTLQLPYTKVVCSLDAFNDYHPELWALPKIYTYSQQETPFLHVDADVFIWGKLNENLIQNELVAQNIEIFTEYYEEMLESLEKELSYFPPEIVHERVSQKTHHSYNLGIVGGRDFEFYKSYASEAKTFIDKNINDLSKINISSFNVFFEQYLFHCISKKENKSVNVLFKEIIPDNKYFGFADFVDVPHNKKYLHLIGPFKKDKQVCNQMAFRLRHDFPEYYYRIITLFKEKGISLYRDYYTQITIPEIWKNKKQDNSEPLVQKTEPNKTTSTANPDLIHFRVPLVKEAIKYFEADLNNHSIHQSGEMHLTDLDFFEQALNKIISEDFVTISKNSLYQRDVKSTNYAKAIFEDPSKTREKVIKSNNSIRILKCLFDWASIDDFENFNANIRTVLTTAPSNIYITIVPECDKRGYSLSRLDKLDIIILKKLQSELTIKALLDELMKSLDSSQPASQAKFENLVFGRLKYGLLNKTIEVVA